MDLINIYDKRNITWVERKIIQVERKIIWSGKQHYMPPYSSYFTVTVLLSCWILEYLVQLLVLLHLVVLKLIYSILIIIFTLVDVACEIQVGLFCTVSFSFNDSDYFDSIEMESEISKFKILSFSVIFIFLFLDLNISSNISPFL